MSKNYKTLTKELYETSFPRTGNRLTGKLAQISCQQPRKSLFRKL